MFFYLYKVLFSGFLQFNGNFVDAKNNSKYSDWAPLRLHVSYVLYIHFPLDINRLPLKNQDTLFIKEFEPAMSTSEVKNLRSSFYSLLYWLISVPDLSPLLYIYLELWKPGWQTLNFLELFTTSPV